jgi:hypothetical protein
MLARLWIDTLLLQQVLDAPELADDYYLNLVDWSSTNVLGVGLGAAVYTWSAQTSEVKKLFDLSESDPPDSVTSISWVQRVSRSLPRVLPQSPLEVDNRRPHLDRVIK